MNDDMLHPAVSSVPNSRLTCSQCERMVQDAIDGALGREDQIQFELHLAGCPSCSRIYEDAMEGMSFLADLKAEPPEPPSLLLSRILAQTSENPEVAIPIRRHEPLLAGAGPRSYPAGHVATVLPFQQPVRRAWPVRMVQSAMEPRFAMTAAMAFFSVALTMNLLGVSPRDFHLSSLSPTSLRHSFWSAKARVVRNYDNLRIVYELESRVNEIRQSDDDRRNAKPAPEKKDTEKEREKGPGTHSRLQPPPDSPPHPTVHRNHTGKRNGNAPFTATAAGNRGEGSLV